MWEKKTGTPWGQYPDPADSCSPAECADPHYVNNVYNWLGGTNGLKFSGTARTVFLAELNDGAFAGHTDWRLPTSAGIPGYPTGSDPELESLITAQSPNCGGPCIDPVLGPTGTRFYGLGPKGYFTSNLEWNTDQAGWVVIVNFGTGVVGHIEAELRGYVRAVRGGPGVP